MKKRYIVSILLLACMLSAIYLLRTKEPEQCPICQSLKHHAPCLVNLASGEVTELELYQPHYSCVGEIADIQDSSTFSFFYAAGVQGTRTTSPYVIELPIPIGNPPEVLSAFCKECRSLLTDQSCGFALIDLYDAASPVAYKIYSGVAYQLRCYQIEIEKDSEKQQYILTVKGTL